MLTLATLTVISNNYDIGRNSYNSTVVRHFMCFTEIDYLHLSQHRKEMKGIVYGHLARKEWKWDLNTWS